MNNEELILKTLKELVSGQGRIESRLDNLETRMDNLETRMDKMGKRQDEMQASIDSMGKRQDEMQSSIEDIKYDVRSIKLHLENVTDKRINLLAEQYERNFKQLEKNTTNINQLIVDLDILKRVVSSHSTDINMIKEKI